MEEKEKDHVVNESPTYESINESIEKIDDVVEGINEGIEDIDEEEVELTEEEKKEIYIKQLKASVIKYHPITHKGNITTNSFGKTKKKHRQKRNAMQRKANQRNRM